MVLTDSAVPKESSPVRSHLLRMALAAILGLEAAVGVVVAAVAVANLAAAAVEVVVEAPVVVAAVHALAATDSAMHQQVVRAAREASVVVERDCRVVVKEAAVVVRQSSGSVAWEAELAVLNCCPRNRSLRSQHQIRSTAVLAEDKSTAVVDIAGWKHDVEAVARVAGKKWAVAAGVCLHCTKTN